MLSPSSSLLAALHLRCSPSASPALPVARARFPPFIGFFCPLYPLSKTCGCFESFCLNCLRLEAKEGIESKVLGTFTAIPDQDPLFYSRHFSN